MEIPLIGDMMKRPKLLIYMIFLAVFGFQSIALSQEWGPSSSIMDYGSEGGAQYFLDDSTDIDSDYDARGARNYQSGINNKDEPVFVSPQDIDNAIEDIKTHGMSKKQRKKYEEKLKQQAAQEQHLQKQLHVKNAPGALFRLPCVVRYNKTFIRPGFYLVSFDGNDTAGTIVIKRGTTTIAEISPDSILNAENKVSAPLIKIDSIDSTELKATLLDQTKEITFKLLK